MITAFEVSVEDWFRRRTAFKHLLRFHIRVLRQHCSTRSIEIDFLRRSAFKRPVTILEALLAELRSLHIGPISYPATVAHDVFMKIIN